MSVAELDPPHGVDFEAVHGFSMTSRVATKQIGVNPSVAHAGQHLKLEQQDRATMVRLTTVAQDGRREELAIQMVSRW